jgi:phosphatidylglycerophosphatase C
LPERDRGTVLFDLDGVLLRCDAFTVLIRHALARRPWRFFPAAVLLTTSLALPPGRPRRFGVNRALVRLALRGIDEARYDALAVRIGTELAKSAFRNDTLIDEASHCRDAGSRVIVVTATERRLARSYLDAVGLCGIELVASELTFPPNQPAWLHTTSVRRRCARLLNSTSIWPAACSTETRQPTFLS